MSTVHYRRMAFCFDDAPVPFLWNPTNPGFSIQMNAISFVAVAWERYITSAVKDVVEAVDDQEVRREAQVFLAQEAQHAAAHRKHVRALCRQYPALESVLESAIDRFDRLHQARPLKFHVAYMANIEATFPALFGLMLDYRDELFSGGDQRVASLMLWHFVEEIEHRSSALAIYQAVIPSRWYRTRVMRESLRHMGGLFQTVLLDLRENMPEEIREVVAPRTWVDLSAIGHAELAGRLPITRQLHRSRVAGNRPFQRLATRSICSTVARIAWSQTPAYNPARERVPDAYRQWMSQFDAGVDMTRCYGRPAERR
jgi:predicted metal-dependent hydrolase